jgi:hypothetical protein
MSTDVDSLAMEALIAYHNDPVVHAKVQQAVQLMHQHKHEHTGHRMEREEEHTALVAAALVLHMQGGDKTYQRVGAVMRLTGEEHATKSRDFGRGFTHCLEVVKEILTGQHDEPSKEEQALEGLRRLQGVPRFMPLRPLDICMIPDCGCDGTPHA